MTVNRFMGPTFFKIFNEIWTYFLRFGNVGGGGGLTPPHPPNVRLCWLYATAVRVHDQEF